MTDDILLIQIDGKMPNLALMKLSAYYKKQGYNVGFNIGDPDHVFISTIFTKNGPQVVGIPKLFDCTVEIGGSGVNIKKTLPDEIEHIMPDYSLYDIDYSMGFTSRGCPNNCPFCIVPVKEGAIREHSPIDEFLHPDHDKVVLLDNNFLASPQWREKIEYLIEWGGKVNFNQGNDIRRVDKEKAEYLAAVDSYDRGFQRRYYYFAWDAVNIESQVKRGIDNLIDAGVKPSYLTFYMLCGFNTSFEEDMYRYKRLWEDWGVYPYVMLYNYEGADNWQGDPRLPHFARWVNARIHKSCQWEEYEPVKPILEVAQ